MKFLVDDKQKIIFGWSAKCGCTHIKKIFLYLYDDVINLEKNCHPTSAKYVSKLPNDIQNYTTIIVSRNPYKRLVSGFLDKYNAHGKYRHKWTHQKLSFNMFINELIKNKQNINGPTKTNKNMNKHARHNKIIIDDHHFGLQTLEYFDEIILKSKKINVYDISNINYEYIESLYNKKIPDILMNKGPHARKCYDNTINYPVYDLHIDDYYNFNINIQYFYSDELKQKIFDFYKNDFIFFGKMDINYNDIMS
jgi:hypothetical protein